MFSGLFQPSGAAERLCVSATNRFSHTHHNELGRLGEDLLPQFESGRGGEQVDALLVQVARLRVDIRSPEEEFLLAVSEDVMSNQVVQQNLTDSNEVQLIEVETN